MNAIFLREKPIKLFLNIKIGSNSKSVTTLSRDTQCTYSHTIKLLDGFKSLNLVTFEKQGRVKYVKLTDKGHELAGCMENMLKVIR